MRIKFTAEIEDFVIKKEIKSEMDGDHLKKYL
jgi:hypothetical protein